MSPTPTVPSKDHAPRRAHRATAEELEKVTELKGEGRRVLVTGASGMLGAAVARLLRDRGWTVRLMQRSAAPLAAEEGFEQVLGSVSDPEAVGKALDRVDDIVHLAAKVSFAGEWEEFVRTNVTGTRVILESARLAGVRNVVFVSSPSVAHQGSSIQGDGAEPADPHGARGNYARSKAAAELLALEADSPGLKVTAIRPHIVWGPGDTQLVERIVDRAARGRLPILDDGAALIDTTYIDNAAEAIVRALERIDVSHGEAFVVTNGQPRPVGEIIALMCKAGSVAPPTRKVPSGVAKLAGRAIEKVWAVKPGKDEPPMTEFLAEQLSTAHWFDQKRTHEVLGWKPAVTIEEGMDRLKSYYTRNPLPVVAEVRQKRLEKVRRKVS
ncbi:NAD-dependent epimerase/dehydratase family protein [Kocuria coralli]|uniref:NAD-dependent epimerase/dehydratase family protein n=1 Tax=Kocuria coralli TaxID=1461025 RepID=A0A5J5L190_9MICC|nr:NAD-dependent epimerase/dehydratase family protein [Kocuria coralli]KAA9395714.1 NAD-dependent epimerase/dehydratase family protein [Kocuria coralli]